MLISKRGNYSVFKDVRDYQVRNDQGLVLKTFGFATDRGEKLAANRAHAYACGMHGKDCIAANREIVARHKCPQCGGEIRRNLSLAGWWQCEQFGAPQFRKMPELPPCNWQCFTE